jgi:hypothetical protein
METQSVKEEELREMARRFRARAAGCPPGHFHDLILQMAGELEELALSLVLESGTERDASGEGMKVKS